MIKPGFKKLLVINELIRQMRAVDDLSIDHELLQRDFDRYGGYVVEDAVVRFSMQRNVRYPGLRELASEIAPIAHKHGAAVAERIMAKHEDSPPVPQGHCRLVADILHYTSTTKEELRKTFADLDQLLVQSYVYTRALRAEALAGCFFKYRCKPISADKGWAMGIRKSEANVLRVLEINKFAPNNRAHLRLLVDRVEEGTSYHGLLSAKLAALEAQAAVNAALASMGLT